jgi:hypothetical protein
MKIKFYALSLVSLTLAVTIAAQTPGGVSPNLTLWVKSDAGTATTGSLLDTWTYVNDGTKSFTATGADRPSLVSSVINFKPSVQFGGGVRFMDGPTGANAPIAAGDDSYTVLVVWQSNTNSAFQRVWSQRSILGFANDACAFSTWDGSAPGPGVYGDETATAPFSHTIQRGYSVSTWNISQLNLLNQATGDLEIVDDRNISSGITTLNTDPGGTPNGAALRAISTTVHRIGASHDGSGPLNGDIAEIIVYDRSINGAERNRIFSYLAMKYGITIKTNLLSSAGVTVWNAAANSTYNNAVFGLSRDNGASGSGLLVNQSNSIETGSGNGTGQNAEGNIVLSNPSSLDDLDFLQIGNDNAALTESVSLDVPVTATGSKRLAREWKVQHTGNVGTFDMTMDFNGLTISATGSIQLRLMVDEDGDGDFTTGTVRFYTPFPYAGGIASFTNVTLNNNEVFTFITQTAGILLPVTWKNFSAKQLNNDVRLDWKVENNANASHYEIEHSSDGTTFERIGTVSNITNDVTYEFLHRGVLSGVHFYRIRQFDFDGKNTYSKIVSVAIKTPDFITYILNNPVMNSSADVVIKAAKPGMALVELWSANGAKLSTKQQTITAGSTVVPVDMRSVQPGNYLIRLTVGDIVQTVQFVKL